MGFPSVAKFVSCCSIPAKRSIVTVVAYAAYVGALVNCLMEAPAMTSKTLVPVYITMAICLVLDLSIFQAGRGEQYCYMVVCLFFSDWVHGCQIVQLGLWLWAGFSKIGPWFPPVFPFLTKDSLHCLLMPKMFHAKLFCKDFPRDMNPGCISNFGQPLGQAWSLFSRSHVAWQIRLLLRSEPSVCAVTMASSSTHCLLLQYLNGTTSVSS